jgi:hypothetical protein
MTLVSDIKLIRTDTTLDLSQKAEKGMPLLSNPALFILPIPLTRLPSLWDKSPTPSLPPLLRFFFSARSLTLPMYSRYETLTLPHHHHPVASPVDDSLSSLPETALLRIITQQSYPIYPGEEAFPFSASGADCLKSRFNNLHWNP